MISSLFECFRPFEKINNGRSATAWINKNGVAERIVIDGCSVYLESGKATEIFPNRPFLANTFFGVSKTDRVISCKQDFADHAAAQIYAFAWRKNVARGRSDIPDPFTLTQR